MDFNVVNENNEFKLGNIISIFRLPDIDREFAVFSIENFDTDDASLNVAYINTDSNGFDYLSDIEDEKILKKAMEVVKDMIGVISKWMVILLR